MGRRESKDRRTSVLYTWGEEGIASGNWELGVVKALNTIMKSNVILWLYERLMCNVKM